MGKQKYTVRLMAVSKRSSIIKGKVQYGSLSHKILNYARFMSRQGDGTFSNADYKKFRFNSVKPSYIQRAINSLVRNGHIQKIGEDRYRFIETNCLAQLDFYYKETLWVKARNSRGRDNKYQEELDDVQSDEF